MMKSTMSISNYTPPAPTWRLCHPVNIYVYRNGIENEKPCLVHIPMEKKKNMDTVLEAIGNRMKLPVGYPAGLYHMDGQRVCKTYELEMYNNYVVVTNLEKRFKCVDYGKVREPLVVIGPYSKHVNTLKMQNKKFDLFCRRKMARKPLHELMANSGEQDGYGPSELPVGKPCGALCHKVIPRRDRPTQCCSDEIMCVEGAAMDVERDDCRQFQREMERQCFEEQRRSMEVPPGTTITDEDCKMLDELQSQVKEAPGSTKNATETAGPLGVNKNLVDLMLRYKDVGSDIFKLFQDKINRDLDNGAENTVSARWQIPGESNLDMETQNRVKEELLRLAGQSCQFTFDKHGNFLFTDGCNIPGAASGGRLSNVAVGTDEPQPGTSKRTSGVEGQGQQRRLSQQGGATSLQGANGKDENEGAFNGESFVANMLLIEEVDEENNISISSIPGLTSSDSKKTLMVEEATGISDTGMEGGEETIEKGVDVQGSGTNKQRGSKLESEIEEIVGNMRRSLVMSKSNSINGGLLPPGMILPSPPRTLSVVQELEEEEYPLEGFGKDEEDELIEQVRATISNGSNKSKESSKKRNNDDNYEGDGGDVNVFSLMMESRNPFREGLVSPLAGKLHKDRLEKLFAENPFRRHWFHRVDTPIAAREQATNPFLKNKLSQEEFILPPPPPSHDGLETTPVFSPRMSRTEWWPPKQPDVFLQQINELVHRHDNTKATSPPPPWPPSRSESASTFTVGPSPRSSQVRMKSNHVACGQSKMDVKSTPKNQQLSHRRNVCAQVGMPTIDEVETEEHQSGVEKLSPRRKPRCFEGGTQTRQMEVESLGALPSEDEKPAGIYEGYQESIKSDVDLASKQLLSSDNDGDDERKVYYRRRRENRKIRRKRKEHCLHPCNNFSQEEEEYAEDEDTDKPDHVTKPFQQIRFVVSNSGTPFTQQQYQPKSCFPEIPPSPQQPIFVQASSTTPTSLPVLTRHPTQTASPTVIKTFPGGIFTGSHSSLQLPIMISQQQNGTIGRGSIILPSTSINSGSSMTTTLSPSRSPLLRQQVVFTAQPTHSLQQQQSPQQYAKVLPVLQPQNTSIRLIKLIHPTQQLINTSTSSSLPTTYASGGGSLQNKLVQMTTPPFQLLQRPQQMHPLSQSQAPSQQQVFYK